MSILIVTPAPPRSLKGNRVTAVRWAGLLRSLGHRVEVSQQYTGQRCDMLIALHARRSAAAMEKFSRAHPDRPRVLALTGTDLYRDIHRSRAAQRSLALATRLVLLQAHGIGELPADAREKARVIYQSVEMPPAPPRLKSVFEVCVSGHLRPVKDPLRAARAARMLPASSRVRVIHLGGALSRAMEQQARREMERNPRYRWLGELPRRQAQRRLARSRLLVLSSRMEGGANVISEAVAAGVPVLASRISGSVGLLGEDYPGYFEVGDTRGLARLLQRAEQDEAYYRRLSAWCRRLKPQFSLDRERRAWQQLLREVLR